MNLDQMLETLLGKEGGYSNNPADKGGETMWGITIDVARAYRYNGPMSMLPRETAKQIYKAKYWFEPNFDKIATISQKISEELLDTGVNMGVGTAGKFLQRALNVLNANATQYPDVTVDGRIGPICVNALKFYLAVRANDSGEEVMLEMLNAQQAIRYMEIAEAQPQNEKFEFGWIKNRVL